MNPALEAPASLLIRDFRRLRADGLPLVLATIVDTAGSTYRKAGTRMLIAAGGETCGLLSGGCLEQDLVEFARDVRATGKARLVSYDMRSADDLLFGLGAGCEGAMRILLQRVGPVEDWQPLAAAEQAIESRRVVAIATVFASGPGAPAPGTAFWDGGATHAAPEPPALASARAAAGRERSPRVVAVDAPPLEALITPVLPPPALLVLGGGPDVQPLARLALAIGLDVTVADHRPAYADPGRFPGCRVLCADADAITASLDPGAFDAAVVMSHHLASDASYLRALAVRGPAYVGLLGPAARRRKLLGDLGAAAAALEGRLRGPVGLDIGARTPEAIALAIVAEIHAVLAGRHGAQVSGGRA
ncbi:MAG: XdhC family protein [Steroidobacteraceae bacterium]|jgi:xanthine/CO dehydrogenase XdhC/CoxF family maturation factor|nr:XdhC family protein [Steroidobacteraceae bacterium]